MNDFRRLCVVLATALLAVQATAAPLFRQPVPLDDALGFTTRMVAADFNGDGFPDLVTAGQGIIRMSLNTGTEPFAAPIVIADPSSHDPALVVGDVNNDGKQDVLYADFTSVVVLLGNGNGTFGAGIITPVSASAYLGVGDVDADGKLDVLVANSAFPPGQMTPYLYWYLGNGSGGFGAVHSMQLSGDTPVSSIAVADVTGDGRADVLVGRDNTTVFVSTSTGLVQTNTLTGVAPAVGRLNADAHPDLVTFHPGQSVLNVYVGNGSGSFTSNGTQSTAGAMGAIADFDDDGVNDVVSAQGEISVFRGLGNGSLAEPVVTAGYAWPFAVGDFDRDGKRDVASVDGFYRGNGDGSFNEDRVYHTRFAEGLGSEGGSAADFNADGRPDAATLLRTSHDGPTEIAVRLNDGSGGLLAPVFTGLAASGLAQAFLVGRLNGDAHPDVLVIFSTGPTAKAFLGNGDGTFTAGSVTAIAVLQSSSPPLLADVTGDGALDLLSGFDVYDGNGDGSFDARRELKVLFHVVGDLDGNGSADVVWRRSPDEAAFALNQGGGTFGAATLLPKYAGAPCAIADFDGDGVKDILTNYGGRVQVFRGKGGGSFHPSITTIVPAVATTTAFPADFNGDGHLDAAFGRDVLLGDGEGHFRGVESARFFSTFAPGDFNGDGKLDLLSVSEGIFSVNLLRIAPEPTRSSTVAFTTSGPLEHATPATFAPTVNGTRQPATGYVLYEISGEPYAIVDVVRAEAVAPQSKAVGSTSFVFPTGTYQMVARFLGNETHLPSSSSPVTLTVDRATTIIGQNTTATGVYGNGLSLTWGVSTARDPMMAQPPSVFTLTENGAPLSNVQWSVKQTSVYIRDLAAGVHLLTVRFEGDANYKPSSKNITLTVQKRNSFFQIADLAPAGEARVAGPVTISAALSVPQEYGTVTGTLEFVIDGQTAGTVTVTPQTMTLTRTLAAGNHPLSIRYSGDSNNKPVDLEWSIPVYLPAGSVTPVLATASNVNVVLRWAPVVGASSYEIHQKTSAAAGWQLATTTSAFQHALAMPAGTTRMFAIAAKAGQTTGAIGPADLATLVLFTDDPVVPGTPIRATHVTQLRTAVNSVRTFAGLSAYPFTDATLTNLMPRALHFTELREALTQARNAIGMPMTFGTAPATGAPIRATHVEELRAGVR